MSFFGNMSDDDQVAWIAGAQLFELMPDNQFRRKPKTTECGVSLLCNGKKYTSTCFYNCVLVFLKEDLNLSAHTLPLEDLLPVGDHQIRLFVDLRGVTVEVYETTLQNPRIYEPSDWKGDAIIKLWLENGHYTLICDPDYK